MLKKIALTASLLAVLTTGVAQTNYTYYFKTINDTNYPLTILGAFVAGGNNNVSVSYMPGQINFQIHDEIGYGFPGRVFVYIGRPNWTDYCKIEIISSASGAIWKNTNECRGPLNLITNSHLEKEVSIAGKQVYSFEISQFDNYHKGGVWE